jgi:hypothetical protein
MKWKQDGIEQQENIKLNSVNYTFSFLPRDHFLVEEVVVLLGADDTAEINLVLVDGQAAVRVVENDFDVRRNDARTCR